MRQRYEIRPKLRLRNHHHFRTQRPQIRADRKPEIHGKVKHVLFAKPFSRQRLARISSRGNKYPVPRGTPPKFLHQTSHGQHFAHRNRVYPDHRLAFSRQRQPRRQPPQPLRQPRAVFPVARHLEEPVGQAHQHSHRQRHAVEKAIERRDQVQPILNKLLFLALSEHRSTPCSLCILRGNGLRTYPRANAFPSIIARCTR